MSREGVQELVEELQVHQVELEIQNEELREIQQQLVAARDRYHELYEFAPVGYLTLDANGVIVEANLATAEIVGADRGHVINARLAEFIARDSQDAFHVHWRALLDGHGRDSCEFALRFPEGERRVAQCWCRAGDSGEAGEPRFRGALLDISERRRAEADLSRMNEQLERTVEERSAAVRHREQQLGAVLDAAPECILTVDRAGRIVSANRAAGIMFGYADEQLTRCAFSDLFVDPESSPASWLLQQSQADFDGTRTIERDEFTAARRDGTRFPARLSLARIDRQDLLVAIIADISEARRLERDVLHVAEEERRRISRELHDSVGQRLAGLMMIARTHEKRFRDSGPDVEDAFAEFRDELAQAVRDTRNVIHDLAPVGLIHGDLTLALERIAENTTALSGVACICECTDPEPHIDSRAKVQLLRIAGEAVHNAVKHASAESIRIGLESSSDGVVLSIVDDGVGMPDRDVRMGESMGLGIMRYRARVAGARLEIRIPPGGGTAVVCTIPV